MVTRLFWVGFSPHVCPEEKSGTGAVCSISGPILHSPPLAGGRGFPSVQSVPVSWLVAGSGRGLGSLQAQTVMGGGWMGTRLSTGDGRPQFCKGSGPD